MSTGDELDRWRVVHTSLEQARGNFNYGTQEDAERDALNWLISAVENLYVVLKPPSAKELK